MFSKEHQKLLKQKYIGIVGKPKWAKITTDNLKNVLPDEDDDLDLLKVSTYLTIKILKFEKVILY